MNYPDDYINKIIHGDCLDIMKTIPNNSIQCIITSPPYWNQKSYSFWPKYSDYMNNVKKWIIEISRILENGRHCFWVIPDKLPFPPKENGTKERLYKRVYGHTEHCAEKAGLICEFPIIWKKKHGTQKMFGSYPYPPTIIHTPFTERICVWRKPGTYKKPTKEIKEQSKMTKEEWVEFGMDVWEVGAETKSDHPAPFPQEIPYRIMKLWSFVDDIIFDPFMGSGTTGLVAKQLNRKYIGIELHEEYCKMANERITNATS